jgi:lysozyme
MSDFDVKLRKLLSLHEGRVPWAYVDSLGFLTIGVGHLIDKKKGGRLPEHIIDALLDYDIQTHRDELYQSAPWVLELDDVRRAALVDMAFNLSVEPFDGDGYKDWPKFVDQMKRKEWDLAANNMRSTLWAEQVGPRAERLAMMIETGQWPQEVA